MQSLGGILRWCLGIGEFIVCDARVTRIRCRRCLARDLCEKELAELKIISVAKRGHTPARTYEVVRTRNWTLLGLSVAAVSLPTGASLTEESAWQKSSPRRRMDSTQNARSGHSLLCPAPVSGDGLADCPTPDARFSRCLLAAGATTTHHSVNASSAEYAKPE